MGEREREGIGAREGKREFFLQLLSYLDRNSGRDDVLELALCERVEDTSSTAVSHHHPGLLDEACTAVELKLGHIQLHRQIWWEEGGGGRGEGGGGGREGRGREGGGGGERGEEGGGRGEGVEGHVHVNPPSQFSRLGMWNICLSVYIFYNLWISISLSLF